MNPSLFRGLELSGSPRAGFLTLLQKTSARVIYKKLNLSLYWTGYSTVISSSSTYSSHSASSIRSVETASRPTLPLPLVVQPFAVGALQPYKNRTTTKLLFKKPEQQNPTFTDNKFSSSQTNPTELPKTYRVVGASAKADATQNRTETRFGVSSQDVDDSVIQQ